jgi:hypothetical protein
MNHNINYLHFCRNNDSIYLFKEVEFKTEHGTLESFPKKTKIFLDSFSSNKQGIDLNLVVNNKKLNLHLNWDEDIPFTHFETAEEAYNHVRFTKVPLSSSLEDFIFDRSPKFATYYSETVDKKLSKHLESKIFKNPKWLYMYSKHFDIKLTEKEEEVFLKDKDGSYAAVYGYDKVKGRLCDMLHNYILMTLANQKIKGYYPTKYIEKYGKEESK